MGRYHPTKKKKTGKIFNVTAIIVGMIIAASWVYFNEFPDSGLTQTVSKNLPLPLRDEVADWAEQAQDALSAVSESIPSDMTDDRAQEEYGVLPELNSSDSFVRERLLKLAPALSPWVQTDQLVRKFLLIINDFSEGTRLARHMRFLKPEQPFSAGQDPDGMFIDEASYRRFDSLAAAINSIDVEAAMALYKQIRPLLIQVYKEFSYPEGYQLEGIFLKAGAEILAAPVIEGRIALVRPSVQYKFADPKNEALNPVHKQMLRLGPDNIRLFQDKVRKLVSALAESSE